MSQKPWVIKAGGELLDDPKTKQRILGALASLKKRRRCVIFVHGGGPQIAHHLKKQGVPIRFVGGRRVTSQAGMKIVEQTLSGVINKDIVATLQKKGVLSVGLSCRDGNMIIGKPIPKLGRAAKPWKVNVSLLKVLTHNKVTPVVSTVASDSKGNAVNINADDAASALAQGLKAERLILLTNTSGVWNQNKKRIPVIKQKEIKKLIQKKIIQGGMIPKIQSAGLAIQNGVKEVDILDGKKGIQLSSGTRIIK